MLFLHLIKKTSPMHSIWQVVIPICQATVNGQETEKLLDYVSQPYLLLTMLKGIH